MDTVQTALNERIKIDAMEMCVSMGLMVKQNEEKGHPYYHHAPVSLFSMPYPDDLLLGVLESQESLSDMICGVISNPNDFVNGILGSFAKHDAFMKRLMDVSVKFNA